MKTEYSLECKICGGYNVQNGNIVDGQITCDDCLGEKTKLKTLKDIEFEGEWIEHGISHQTLLRWEAVKWVKYYEKLPKVMKYHNHVDENVIKFIKEFFNLTEEDLR